MAVTHAANLIAAGIAVETDETDVSDCPEPERSLGYAEICQVNSDRSPFKTALLGRRRGAAI